MRPRTFVILPAALITSFVSGCSQSTTPTPAVCSAPQGEHAAAKTLATADTSFSLAMYPKTVAAHGATQNLIVSPYSASASLTMLQAGAAGETAAQMQTALSLPGSAATIAPAYASLACEDETDGSSSGNTLSISNAVWVDQSLTLEKTFQSLLAKGFAAPVQATNFGDPTAAAWETSSRWIS
jgi:serine protease inhibitor